MSSVIVQYTVKPDRVEENKQLVEAVFAKLQEVAPSGLRYMSFIKDDGKTFVHVSSSESDENPQTELEEFKAFQKDLKDRCEVPPQVTKVELVGSY